MNSLSSLPPPLLATPAGPGRALLPPAAAPAGAARQAASWLDDGHAGGSEPLHIGPHSGPRAIDDIERDFLQALCQAAAEER